MRKILTFASAVVITSTAFAQNAFNAYRFSQPDMKGTARFMSMGGAFTALGGDLSCISQNPGGIGIYRNSEVGITVDIDVQQSTSNSEGLKTTLDQTKFLLNNVGLIWTLKLPSATCPNINFGFTYNKTASFNRRYAGDINLRNSLSNALALDANAYGLTGDDLYDSGSNSGYNPYYDTYAGWLPILGYNSYLISQDPSSDTRYQGQWINGKTSGIGTFDVIESGGIDSYNIAIGGNISDIIFWGMDFDITHMNYNLNPVWWETLNDARVDGGTFNADWYMENFYNCSGTGFNYKFGFIVKPIQELRLGFSFHTPTWYNLTENYNGYIDYIYENETDYSDGRATTPYASDNFNFRTPWKINAGVAAVLFNRLILSADYEWAQYGKMKFSQPSYSWGYWDDPDYPYPPYDYPYIEDGIVYDGAHTTPQGIYTTPNSKIGEYYKSTNTFRFGAELRIIPQLSLRAGYAYVSSPVKSLPYKGDLEVDNSTYTFPNYRLDNATNYISGGVGFRAGGFYIDAAYVYKHISSEYHAYMPVGSSNPSASIIPSPTSKLSLNNSQIVISAGYKF